MRATVPCRFTTTSFAAPVDASLIWPQPSGTPAFVEIDAGATGSVISYVPEPGVGAPVPQMIVIEPTRNGPSIHQSHSLVGDVPSVGFVVVAVSVGVFATPPCPSPTSGFHAPS